MKRGFLSFLAVCLLAGLMAVTMPKAQAATTHTDHCVCGGSVGNTDHHSCQPVAWTPLSQALSKVGLTMKTADFGKLPSGNYYLDGDVIVAKDTNVGTTIASVDIKICLNGHKVTRETGKLFGYLKPGSVLSLCDCSGKQDAEGNWSWEGTMTGGVHTNGSIIYTHYNSVLNVYGGNYIGRAATSAGAFGIACDGCPDLNGDGTANSDDKNIAPPSVMNLYNGSISGSSVQMDGGSIRLFHTAQMNMYGGTVANGTSVKNGGNLFCGSLNALHIYGGAILDGTANKGGNIHAVGTFSIQNATVAGGTAASYGNIYCSKTVDLSGNTIYGGYPEAVQIVTVTDGTETVSCDYTLADALKLVDENSYLRLNGDLHEEVTVSGTVYLDMNGYDLSGITVTGTLYGFDSTTDDYNGDLAGTLTCTLSGGQVAMESNLEENRLGAIRRYLSVPGADGTYSFHRFYLGITTITLKPSSTGMGYTALFRGDEAVKSMLKGEYAFGYKLWISRGHRVTRGYRADQFTGNQTMTLRLENIMSTNNDMLTNLINGKESIHAVAYFSLKDGTVIQSSEASYSFRDTVELADVNYQKYSTAQKNALQDLNDRFENIFLGWDIPNIQHVTANGWQKVNGAAFAQKLTANGTQSVGGVDFSRYDLAEGKYQLTENIDLNDKLVRVPRGVEVTICLNGHTITGKARCFAVYGTLNICDCHAHEQEGKIVSTLSGENMLAPVAYIYCGTLNLYGGHLSATETMKAAGVLAIGKSGTVTGVFNMYGGSVSEGKTTSNSGLMAIWDGSTFNMYGGEMHNGSANGYAGGFNVSGDCTANLYGGEIYNCYTTGNGGGVYLNVEGRLYAGNVVIRDNEAAGNGGNLCSYAEGTLVMNGALITGGRAASGSGMYLGKGQLNLLGDTRIVENVGENLRQIPGAKLNVDGLTENAKICLDTSHISYLGTNAASQNKIVLSDSSLYVDMINGKLAVVTAGIGVIPEVSDGFTVGFGRADISPQETGLPLAGYGNSADRLSTMIPTEEYDKLKVTCVAVTDEAGETVLIMSADLIRPSATLMDAILPAVSLVTGVPEGNIFVTFTHTHSVPETRTITDPTIARYTELLVKQFTRSAYDAMVDRAPAIMELGSFEVDGMNFVRHYTYLDANGVLQYFGDNFGEATYNDTTEHVSQADETMYLARFNRDGEDILMVNWRVHPHMTGSGTKTVVSADIIGTMRVAVEAELGVKFIYIQGAAGNINEKSRLSKYNHGLDYVQYGEEMAKQIHTALQGDILRETDPGLIQVENYTYTAQTDHSEDYRYEDAVAFRTLYAETLPTLTTSAARLKFCRDHGYSSIFEANAIVTRYNSEASLEMPLNVFSIGSHLAFFTAPGELWDAVSVEVEEYSKFDMTMCMGYSMDHFNYFVYGSGLTYASYESANHRFVAPNTINDMIAYWKQGLDRLYSNTETE